MNKKKIGIVSVITIVVVLFASTFLVAFASADKDVQYIKTAYYSDMNGQTIIIESKEELDEYFNANKEKYNLGHREKVYADSTIGFEDAIEKYDEEFFKNKNIVLLLVTATSGSITYKADNITINDGVMDVKISRHAPEYCDCMMAGWHIIVETEKVSINEINVFVEGQEITK